MAVGQGIEAVPCAAAGKGLWDSTVSCRGEGDAITVTHTHTHSSHHHPAPTLLGAASGRPVHWLGLTTAGTTKLSHGLDRRRGYILLYVLQRRHFHGHSRTGLRRRGEMSEINASRRRSTRSRRACMGRHIWRLATTTSMHGLHAGVPSSICFRPRRRCSKQHGVRWDSTASW
jgi:hypothetical protein